MSLSSLLNYAEKPPEASTTKLSRLTPLSSPARAPTRERVKLPSSLNTTTQLRRIYRRLERRVSCGEILLLGGKKLAKKPILRCTKLLSISYRSQLPPASARELSAEQEGLLLLSVTHSLDPRSKLYNYKRIGLKKAS